MHLEDLSSYLNDHLAGSVGALELLDRLMNIYKGKPLERFFRDLRNEIDADQETLKELIAKLGEKESAVRKAGAWIVEKLSRAKIQLSEAREGEMGLFLALEGLVLGISRKRIALARACGRVGKRAAPARPGLREAGEARGGTARPRGSEAAGSCPKSLQTRAQHWMSSTICPFNVRTRLSGTRAGDAEQRKPKYESPGLRGDRVLGSCHPSTMPLRIA